MLSRKILFPFLVLFTIVSIPHFEAAIHAIVHAYKILHTHDHAEATRTGAHFHFDDHHYDVTPSSKETPVNDHHHEYHWEQAPTAILSANSVHFENLARSQVLRLSVSYFLKPLPQIVSSPWKDPSPPGGLLRAFFRSNPSKAPPAC